MATKSELEEQLAEANERIEELEGELENANDEIDTLQSEIDDFEDRYDEGRDDGYAEALDEAARAIENLQ